MRSILISILIIFFISSCSFYDGIKNLLPTNSTDIPYFMDDFSDHANGWNLTDQDNGVVQYDGEALRMIIKKPANELWSVPGLSIKNPSINVVAEMIGGPDNNLYGIICRYVDASNYYAFLISSDGYYAITKTIKGVRTVLSSDSFEPSTFILKGQKNNHIRADCNGPILTMYVNWEKLTGVSDLDLSYGDVGLITGSLAEPGTDIKFDNFIVIKTD
jgi:hypothetical protein